MALSILSHRFPQYFLLLTGSLLMTKLLLVALFGLLGFEKHFLGYYWDRTRCHSYWGHCQQLKCPFPTGTEPLPVAAPRRFPEVPLGDIPGIACVGIISCG